ncbi:uncharacterized protein HaLaN_09444 [Haematococcus lacustris]|uniref:Uncharacterized protein n=1 Tax=Haematococcus lacustris TaxID=44745 RepID=A0A699ZDG9_HAELA|nr:uncharacterized protein HaLaN_09444 [Haematococcus lacustris]
MEPPTQQPRCPGPNTPTAVVLKNTGLGRVAWLGGSVDVQFRCCRCLGSLAPDAAGQLDVLGHDGHALGVDGRQVGVLEQAHQVRLGRLLQRQHGAGLEAQLADEQLGGLLVLADLAQRYSAGAVAMGLLHASSGGSALAGCLGGQLLAGSLATGGLASGLLGAGHSCSV